MAEPPKPSIDPFADDIVDDPRHVDYSVPGLNESIAGGVIAGIDALAKAERPRTSARSSKALLVLSPRAGFGKSHLIGSLFKQLAGRATLVNVRPFEDPETCWKSILMRVVQELDFPDRYTETETDTQLELFAHGVLSQVVADYLEAGNGKPQTIETLRRPAEHLTWLKHNETWRGAMKDHIGNSQWVGSVRQRLGRKGFNPRASLETWLKVLYGYTYRDDDWSIRQSCLDWLQGDPIDDEAARAIGIRPADLPAVEQTAGAVNDMAKSRVLDLCRLAGFFRPFLICFDQTETYGKSEHLARALGTVVTDLVDEAANQLTVMTANIDPWEKRLRDHWEEASRDRLARPYLSLKGISLEQGITLAEHRMRLLDTPRTIIDRFWEDRQWLESCFRESTDVSVRMFLHACSRRWAEIDQRPADSTPPEGRTSLPVLFQRYVDEVSARPRRLVYDRDTLYWLVSELADGLEGVTVDKLPSTRNTHLPCWRHGDRQFVFGFESGNHWKRWHNIARSVLPGGSRQDGILVYPRTPELPSVPREGWKVARTDIERAKRSRLLILELDRHQLVRLYAAQELYADALQGDIDWSTEEVGEFLRKELADFWEAILSWPESRPGPDPDGTTPADPPSGELSDSVVDVVRRQRFLSLDDLMDKLPGDPDREAVLGICGETASIKVYAHPNMTVLQWQTTA